MYSPFKPGCTKYEVQRMGDRLVRDRLPELSFQVGGHRTMKVQAF